jgi:hypothetical protein
MQSVSDCYRSVKLKQALQAGFPLPHLTLFSVTPTGNVSGVAVIVQPLNASEQSPAVIVACSALMATA